MATLAVTIFQTAVGLVTAALYIWVARIVLVKDVEGEAKRANVMFAVWWLALALLYFVAPLLSLPPQFGYRDLALAVTVLNIVFLLIVVAIWGLVYYLAYLYTGDKRWFWPLAVFYFLLGCGLLYFLTWLDPSGFKDDGSLAFTKQSTGAPAISPVISIAFGLAFIIPVLIAAVAYGTLFFRVHEPGPRYRIGMVSGAFILQFGWSAISTILQLSVKYPDSLGLALLGNALGIASAVIILLAFRPPRGIRERLAATSSGGMR